jgi:rhodanese-related sulfurtransferase
MTDQIARGDIQPDPFEEFGYRITGWVPHAAARGIDPNLDVPLISHVEGNLWQGGCLGGVRLPDYFDFVLSLYPWESYTLGPNTERAEVKMYDSLDQTFEQVDELAHLVKEYLDADKTVLVHCQAGLNRSGLLAARTLMLLGHTPEVAIEMLRTKRSPLVLCNEAFENWLYRRVG